MTKIEEISRQIKHILILKIYYYNFRCIINKFTYDVSIAKYHYMCEEELTILCYCNFEAVFKFKGDSFKFINHIHLDENLVLHILDKFYQELLRRKLLQC